LLHQGGGEKKKCSANARGSKENGRIVGGLAHEIRVIQTFFSLSSCFRIVVDEWQHYY
jgi:hypothetical protein